MVHPAKLASELARACVDAGVEIFEHSPVSGIDSELPNIPVMLTTKDGFLNADRVALATNAFPSLLRRYRLHTVPVYDYVLMTDPLTDAQRASIGWDGRQGIADLASHFFTTSPQLEGIRFSHRWAGVIDTSSRFCAFYGLTRRGRVADSDGFGGVQAARWALDLADHDEGRRNALLKSLGAAGLGFDS